MPDLGGMYLLTRVVGLNKAKELCFTAKRLSANEAHALGIVNHVVAPDQLLSEAQRVARQIAAGPPTSLAMMKTLLNKSSTSTLDQMLEYESFAQTVAYITPEHREGVAAFREKREPRLAGDVDRLNWLVGVSFDDAKSEQSNFFRLADYSGNEPIPGLPITLTLNEFESRFKTYAGFANGEFQITPRFSVSAGVRYTKNEQEASYCYNDPAIDAGQTTAAVFSIFQNLFTGQTLPPIQPGECFPLGDGLLGTTFGQATRTPLHRDLDQNNTSFRTGVNYKLEQGSLLYATVSQGYKTGIFSAIGASSTSQYASAVQEKVVAYETGIKAPLFDRRMNLNGAVFYYDYTDKQVRGRILDPIYGLLEKMVNVPKSYVWGVEGEVQARPTQGLTFSVSATYLKSRVNGSFAQTADGSAVYNAAGYTGDFKGSTLPFTPELSANADVQYEWNVGDKLIPFIGGSVLYQDSENTTFRNAVLLADDFEIPSYYLVDLRAGLRSQDDKWQVSVFGRNVFDKDYTTSITTFLDTRFRLTGRPGTYGVALKWNLA